MLELDENNFEAEVLQADVPVLVDFWAEWCGPCKMVGPVIEELVGEYQGRAKIGKCDVDKAPDLAAKYGVRNIPTVLVFKGGEPCDTIIGARQKGDYQAALNSALGGAPDTR